MDERTGRDAQLAARLEAYAEAALHPDPVATARTRSAVMAAAEAAATVRPAASAATAPVASPTTSPTASPTTPVVVPASSPGGRSMWSTWRRAAALLAAAAIILVVAGGTLAAVGPGGPLYELRLGLEAAALPGSGDARSDAQAERLERRLGEIRAAATSGDAEALRAAVEAYRAAVDDALDDPAAGGPATERLELALERHRVVLATVLAGAPEASRAGLERAIDRSDRAIEQLMDRIDDPAGPGGGPNAEPSKGPAASDTPEPSKGPAASDTPEPSKGPAASDKPEPSKGPDKSPKP
jgi:hypothetical protein